MGGEYPPRALFHIALPDYRGGSLAVTKPGVDGVAKPCRSGQHGPERGNRRHEEISSGGELYELFRNSESRSPVAGRVVGNWLVHLTRTVAGGLSDDRIEPRCYWPAPEAHLPVDKAGVVCIALLNELELSLARDLIAHEH